MSFWHEHIALIASDLLRGRQVHRYLRHVAAAERWSVDKILAFREAKLRQLIEYAAATVPFYRDWFASTAHDPTTVQLGQLPIVDKATMRREGIERFAAEGFTTKERLLQHSSGSTGEPFAYYSSRLADSVNTASKIYTWQQADYRLGDRYIKIANSERHSRIKRLQDSANRCLYVPFAKLDTVNLRSILLQIEAFRPRIIRSYPSPLFLLARQREVDGCYSFRPEHIMTTGATLSAASRELIERAFGCDVIDSYSCEGTTNTYETPAHDGYHQCLYYGITEVLDEGQRPVSDGVGRVVSTDLWNLAQPFIRYDTQDLVEVRDGRIVRIIGRSGDQYLSAHGTTYTSHNFSHYFLHDVKGVDAYQIVVRSDHSILIRFITNPQYSPSVEQQIIHHWQPLLGLPVSVAVVDHIPLMHNNKYLTIVNE